MPPVVLLFQRASIYIFNLFSTDKQTNTEFIINMKQVYTQKRWINYILFQIISKMHFSTH